MDGGLRASAVESRAVCFADIRLGAVVDVLLDDSLQRVLGFDVLCGDRLHRYLPLPACEIGENVISVPSALVLMRQELDFYRDRGRALTAVRGFPVRREGRSLGIVLDLVFTPEGELVEIVVETDEGETTVEAGPGLVVGPDALRPAV
ncbi:MAG TPA: hypothetical protein VFG61_06060 [Gaiellaceae bacterium]|jgi:uncharacterized protein YrrD|nr:hypothetical protein [Gaiellaceae bacterium]